MTLAIANILRRKIRSLISVLAVSIGITLLLVLVGVTKGSIKEVANRIQNVGADLIIQQAGASDLFALKSGILPLQYKKLLKEIPHVEAVSPVVTWTATIDGQIYVVYGIDTEAFSSVGGELEILKGRYFENGSELMVDDRLASVGNYRVGDKLNLMAKDFMIAGICRAGIGARIFMPMSTLQEMLHQEGRVSLFFVKCDSPENVDSVAETIEKNYKNRLKVMRIDGFLNRLSTNLTGLNEFITVISTICLIISFLVILLAMYTTIVERTKEIGILKSLGASRFFILKNIVAESVILSCLGILLGYVFTYLTTYYLRVTKPLLTVEITSGWILTAAVLGIIGGTLGALYPAFRAVQQDPVVALSYE